MILRRIGARKCRRAFQAPIAPSYKSPRFECRYSTTTGQDEVPAGADADADAGLFGATLATATTPLERHAASVARQAAVRQIGSAMTRMHHPRLLLASPPTVRDTTLEALMAAQTHMGHNTAVWHPDNSRYIYGTRSGIHIISLEQTSAHLRRAAKVVEDVAYRAGIILFVGTRKGQRRIVTTAAGLSGACRLFNKWAPGTITNREIMLKDREITVLNEQDKPVEGFHRHLSDRSTLIPDLVICLNPVENYTMLYECALATIPTIGIIDTDADPSWVTYAIPANDDSFRSVGFIASVLGQAAKEGKERRLDHASRGIVTWETPSEIQDHIDATGERRQQMLSELEERLAVDMGDKVKGSKSVGDKASNDETDDGSSSSEKEDDGMDETRRRERESVKRQQEESEQAARELYERPGDAELDARIDAEALALAAELGWDGSKRPATDEEREFMEAHREYQALMHRRLPFGDEEDDDAVLMTNVARAIDESGDVDPPAVPEKDADRAAMEAEQAILGLRLDGKPGPADDVERNKWIMDKTNVTKLPGKVDSSKEGDGSTTSDEAGKPRDGPPKE